MGKLIRCITDDGLVSITAVDSTDIVNTAQEIHQTSAVTSAALGRLLSAACMMGSSLKYGSESVTLRVKGSGPAGSVLAVSDSEGNVRGYVQNPVVEIPLNSKGKLDVAGAVGADGTLSVIKDMGLKEPHTAQIPLVSGEIAEDITSYFAISEQTPTVCALGVLVAPELTIAAAGGFLIQLLPAAGDETAQRVEKGLAGLPSVTQMLSQGLSPEEICSRALPDFNVEKLEESTVTYRCSCSVEKVERALVGTGRAELEDMAKDPETSVTCHFCRKKYVFTPNEILALARRASE